MYTAYKKARLAYSNALTTFLSVYHLTRSQGDSRLPSWGRSCGRRWMVRGMIGPRRTRPDRGRMATPATELEQSGRCRIPGSSDPALTALQGGVDGPSKSMVGHLRLAGELVLPQCGRQLDRCDHRSRTAS